MHLIQSMIVLSKNVHNVLSQLMCISPVKYLSSEIYSQQHFEISHQWCISCEVSCQ